MEYQLVSEVAGKFEHTFSSNNFKLFYAYLLFQWDIKAISLYVVGFEIVFFLGPFWKNNKDLTYKYHSASRGQLRASLKLPVHHSTIVLSGLRGTPNLAPIIPRNASLSDSLCEIFQSGEIGSIYPVSRDAKLLINFSNSIYWISDSIWGCTPENRFPLDVRIPICYVVKKVSRRIIMKWKNKWNQMPTDSS